jgi:hypothetical protein
MPVGHTAWARRKRSVFEAFLLFTIIHYCERVLLTSQAENDIN